MGRIESTLTLLMVLFLVAVASPRSASAQQAAGRSQQKAPAYAAGDLYLKGSRVYTRVFKTGLGHEHAVEGMIKGGHVRLGATSDAGEIVLDMASYRADTQAARKYLGLPGSTDESTQRQVNANMLGSSVLDVERFPTAVFKIDSAQALSQPSRRGLKQYQLVGQFTLHGVTRKLTVVADAELKNGWTHLRGDFNINQTDFGIKPFTKAFGAVGIADRLVIRGDFWVAGTSAVAQRNATNR